MSATTPDDGPPVPVPAAGSVPAGGYDPLRLCIYSTVALIAWLAGPFALVFFAGLGLTGYVRARRAGLTRSKCYLRDTRLVIGYLSLLVLAGIAAAAWRIAHAGWW
jgi:hypothetical protein